MSWNMRDLTFDAMRVWNYMLWSWLDLMRAPWMPPSESGYPGMGGPPGWPPGPQGPWASSFGAQPPPPFGAQPPPPFGGQPPPPSFGGQPAPFATGPQARPTGDTLLCGVKVSLFMQSSTERPRGAEVKVELYPGADISRLVVEELRASSHSASVHALRGIKIQPTGVNSAECFIEILADQPAGTYEGLIYEPMNYRPMSYEPTSPKVSGFIRVRILEQEVGSPGSPPASEK